MPNRHGTDTRTAVLNEAIPLFAKRGFSDVSMRDLAEAVGIRAPALYNHFKDKQSLYMEAVSHAFQVKAQSLSSALSSSGPADQRLARFVESLCDIIGKDPDFRMLLQRELLDGDEARLRALARDIFSEQFLAASRLAEELNPTCDAHMLTISIAGLVLHHFELGPLRRYFPGSRTEHEDPAYIARHVTRLLLHGVSGLRGPTEKGADDNV